MNAVEIEEAVSTLAAAPFDPAESPFAFLAAFGNKDTTVKRLRTGGILLERVPCSGTSSIFRRRFRSSQGTVPDRG